MVVRLAAKTLILPGQLLSFFSLVVVAGRCDPSLTPAILMRRHHVGKLRVEDDVKWTRFAPRPVHCTGKLAQVSLHSVFYAASGIGGECVPLGRIKVVYRFD